MLSECQGHASLLFMEGAVLLLFIGSSIDLSLCRSKYKPWMEALLPAFKVFNSVINQFKKADRLMFLRCHGCTLCTNKKGMKVESGRVLGAAILTC